MMTRKKIMILLAALLVLGGVLTTPLSNIARLGSSYYTPPSPEGVLSVSEINAFLGVWSQFMQKDLSQSMRQISLNQDGSIPPQVVRWLHAQGWNAERFFAVEQHLRELAAVATLQNSLEENRQLLPKISGAGAQNLQNIIASQEQQLKALRYNPQELALVRANIYQISQVLDGKAVVQ